MSKLTRGRRLRKERRLGIVPVDIEHCDCDFVAPIDQTRTRLTAIIERELE